MRLLVADDQERVRSAIRLVLKDEAEIEYIGEVGEPEQIIPSIGKMRPDVLLLDWEMPVCPVKYLLDAIRTAFPRVIVIVMSAQGVTQAQAMEAGARALISKVEPPEQMINLIHQFGNASVQKNI